MGDDDDEHWRFAVDGRDDGDRQRRIGLNDEQDIREILRGRV